MPKKKHKPLPAEEENPEEIKMAGQLCSFSETTYMAADGVETIKVEAIPLKPRGNLFSMGKNWDRIFGRKKK